MEFINGGVYRFFVNAQIFLNFFCQKLFFRFFVNDDNVKKNMLKNEPGGSRVSLAFSKKSLKDR